MTKTIETLSPNDTGKALRAALKTTFPGVKFSVRKDGYNTFRIRWTDGPMQTEVDVIANAFQGTTFDGSTDSTIYLHTQIEWNGGIYETGAGYVFTSRDLSDGWKAAAEERIRFLGYNGSDLDMACAIRMFLNGESIESAAHHNHLQLN